MLTEKHCTPLAKGATPLDENSGRKLLTQLHQDWSIEDSNTLHRRFGFGNFHQTMAFVNAVAWIAHREDHHPDLEVGYKRCTVRYTSHAAGGLTENDFICAAHIDHLLAR